MNDQLPRGWRSVPLAQLCDPDAPIMYGILQPGPDVASGVPYVRPTEIQGDEIQLADIKRTTPKIAEQYRRASLKQGDVLLSIVGTIGKVALVPKELEGGNITQSSVRIRPSAVTSSSFLRLLLKSPQIVAQYDRLRLGTGVPRLNVGDVRQLVCPLPPLNEQRRIVTKLESLQSRSRRAREALDTVPPLLEKLRQSILAAAFRGDLTKDWRAQNPNPEPASALLARIRTERRQKWEAAELAKLRHKGKAPTNDSWKAKYKEPEPVDATGLPELPDSWCWASVDELLAEGLANGRSVLTDDNGFPVLRLTALKHGRLDLKERKGGAWSAEDAAPFLVKRNDFLVSRGSGSLALVGRGGLVDTEPDGVAFPDTLIRLRAHELLSHEYLSRVWNAALVRTQIERAAKTTAGIFKVSQSDLESIVLPVPSLGEQTRVCSILDATLDGVRRLEIAANAAEGASKTLERSLLAKAFRGDLVPQDPNDEPADTMLARVVTGAHADASGKRPRHAKAAE